MALQDALDHLDRIASESMTGWPYLYEFEPVMKSIKLVIKKIMAANAMTNPLESKQALQDALNDPCEPIPHIEEDSDYASSSMNSSIDS